LYGERAENGKTKVTNFGQFRVAKTRLAITPI
jgi:hypothetical protein